VTVYFVSPATTQEPIGGVRKIYDHVDILNSAGIEASVIQGQAGFRPSWFPNETPVAYAPVGVRGNDILVWPEYLTQHVRSKDTRQVIFVQGAYGLFADTDPDLLAMKFSASAVTAVAVVSEDTAAYVRYGWPQHEPVILRAGIDPAVFRPGVARKQIAYSPRRRYRAVQQVIGLLRAHEALVGWELVEIVGMNQAQVAETLSRSALFLSFSEREGFGLPPLEALVSGCHVIGFTGMGGREFFDARYADAIPEDDIVAYARAVENWLTNYNEVTATALGREGSNWALERYSLEQERTKVIDFYARLLTSPPATGTTVVRPEETWGPHDKPRSAARRGLGQIRAGLRTMRGR
jgi:hypothetical protein